MKILLTPEDIQEALVMYASKLIILKPGNSLSVSLEGDSAVINVTQSTTTNGECILPCQYF